MNSIKLLTLTLLLTTSAASFAQNINWQAIANSYVKKAIEAKKIKYPELLPAKWKNKYQINPAENHVKWTKKNLTNFKCDKEVLVPTHKAQDMKNYHLFQTKTYSNKVPGASLECLVHTRNAQKFCIKPDSLNIVLVSDIYKDKCGNVYRAVAFKSFLTGIESMGTLFSPGRTAYQKPNSRFRNDTQPGHTYEVPAKDFLLFFKLNKKERAKVRGYL